MKAGDVVMLKSGGPKMTILSFDDVSSGRAFCGWFTSDDQPQFTYFQVCALKEVKE